MKPVYYPLYILTELEKFILKHNQNNLTIEIATYSYIDDVFQFEYTLEGFVIKLEPHAGQVYHLHQPTGKLYIKGSSGYFWKGKVKKPVWIFMAPPFYASIWAYLLYTCIIQVWYHRFLCPANPTTCFASLSTKEKKNILRPSIKWKSTFFHQCISWIQDPLTLILGQLEAFNPNGKLTEYCSQPIGTHL